MITVIFNEQDHHEAQAHVDYMLEKKPQGETQCYRPDYNKIGILGEIAFSKYLTYIGVDFIRSNGQYFHGKGDDYDFLVAGKKIDVKASSKFWTTVLSEKRTKKAQSMDVIVFVKVNLKDNKGVIVGYCPPSCYTRDATRDTVFKGKRTEMYSIPKGKYTRFKIDNLIIH